MRGQELQGLLTEPVRRYVYTTLQTQPVRELKSILGKAADTIRSALVAQFPPLA